MNRLLLIITFSLFTFLVHAQGESHVGIKAGLTNANIYGSDVAQLSTKGSPTTLQGFNFGVFVNSKMRKYFWLKSELLFIQKGATLSRQTSNGQEYSSKFKNQYIEVYPLSATFHWKGFQILAGPYVSMLLKSTQQDSVGNNVSVFGSAGSLASYRQKLDAGIVLGIEYELPKLGISIGARYTKGYMPLFENDGVLTATAGAPTPATQKIYNEALLFSVGYSFGKKK